MCKKSNKKDHNQILSRLDEAIVRVVVRTNAEFLLTTYNEWFLTSDNTPYILHRGRNFADVRMMWGNYWPYCSTLIKEVHSSGPWQVVELSEEYLYKDDCAGPILECEVDHDILTIMGVHAHGVEYFGILCEDSPAPVDNPGVDIPLIDGDVAMPEEVQHAAPHAAGPEAGAEVAGDVLMLKLKFQRRFQLKVWN